jgi:hypothetical protein
MTSGSILAAGFAELCVLRGLTHGQTHVPPATKTQRQSPGFSQIDRHSLRDGLTEQDDVSIQPICFSEK